MNQKEFLAAMAKMFSTSQVEKAPRKAPKQNLAKAPPKMGKNTGRAQGLIGITCMVPKKVYKLVVDHCREEEITISHYIRSLVDADRGTTMVGTVEAHRFTTPANPARRKTTYRHKPKPSKPRALKPGDKRKGHTDEEVAEYVELFHKENPDAAAHDIFNHLRKQYGLRFGHTRGMRILQKIRAQSLNGKSENVG